MILNNILYIHKIFNICIYFGICILHGTYIMFTVLCKKINVLIHVCIFNDKRRGEEREHDKLSIQSAVCDNMLMILVFVLNLHLSSCIKQTKKPTHTQMLKYGNDVRLIKKIMKTRKS